MSGAPATTARRGADERHLRLAIEIALGVVTVAAILSMHRLFIDGSYRGALVLQAVVAHAVVTVLRRAGVRIVPAAIVTIAAGALFITWTRFPETTAWGIPTGDTLTSTSGDIGSAWRLFGDESAPVAVDNGFVVTAAWAVWVIAFMADWAAFRVSAAFEAILPATVLFVFAAALGGDSSPVASAAFFAASALVFLLLYRTAEQMHAARWAGGERRYGRWWLIATGAGLIGTAVLVGAAAGPQLPGADTEAVLAWQDINNDDPTRVVPSPLVSVQTQLLDQPNVELFTVRSNRSSYWRLTALDEFNGETWRSSYSTDDADGQLPVAVDASVDADAVRQEVSIKALSSVWLPAALEPRAIDPGPEQKVVYDERSATLMVDRGVATSDDYTYTVTSALADWSADELRTASDAVPGDIAERYLQLPDSIPERVEATAREITGDQATPYDKARALQEWFRSGRFTYDDEVGTGQSNQALVSFLYETQRGYCQQFAGSYAALARAAGLPARVAVGFTPGVQDEFDPELFRVRGIHAHAWAEVYLGEYGWVPFDPTPGRAPPRAANWLGMQEQQDTSMGGDAVTDPVGVGGSGDIPGNTDGIAAAGDAQRQPTGGLEAEIGGGGVGAGEDDEPVLATAVKEGAPAVGIGLMGYLLVVPVALALQQLIRRRRARTPAAQVDLGWIEATESVRDTGVALPPWMTVKEKAARMAAAVPRAADEVHVLASYVERAAYAPVPPTEADADAASDARAAVEAEIRRRQSLSVRLARHLDVRRLFRARRHSQVVTGDVVRGDVVAGNVVGNGTRAASDDALVAPTAT